MGGEECLELHIIVYVYGANIEQKTIGYGWRQNQEAKLKIVGGDLPGSNQQDLDSNFSQYNICNYA